MGTGINSRTLKVMSKVSMTGVPSSAASQKSLSNRGEVKRRITKMYHHSIKQNPGLLTEQHITLLKLNLYEKFPAKVTQLTVDCGSIYSRESLKSSASSWDTLSASVPIFATVDQVVQYRDLYQREYGPYIASENSTILLSNGPVATNAKFGDIIRRLLTEVETFLWALNECRIALYLCKPPFGEEKSFDSRILSIAIATLESVYRSTRAKQASLRGAFSKRAADTVRLAIRPQTMDTRHYVAHSEEQLFIDLALYATLVRNNYAIVHQFAVKNATRIERILADALKNAKYGKNVDNA